MPTILLKKSDTPGSVPGTANLTNLAGGVEVAVNTADKRMYSMTSASAVIELGTNPSSLTCADASFTLMKAASASITNLTLTSLVISNLSIASANVTTLTSASATITNLLATSLTVSSGSTLNGGVVINEPGADADTRIEGDTDANLFFADASTDRIGIGTSSPGYKLDVNNTNGSAATARLNGNDQANVRLRLENGGSGGRTWEIVGGLPGANNANFSIRDVTGSTTPLTIDSSGNLGLGVTPAGWTTYKAMQFSTTGAIAAASGGDMVVGNNYYYDGANKYLTTAPATYYYQYNGAHSWHNAPSGTAGTTATFTQAMTLDASGRLGVGDTSPQASYRVTITGGGALNTPTGGITFRQGATDVCYFGNIATDNTTDWEIWNPRNGYTRFATNNLERARITSGGRLTVKTSTYDNGIVTADNSWDPASASWATLGASFAGVGSYGGGMLFIDSNTAGYALWTQDSGKDFYIKGNTVGVAMTGGVYLNDYATSWSSASDENVKDIIEPIENAIEKVVTLRTVIGKYKDEAEGKRHPFLIAQDVEKVLPEAVSKMNKGQDNECLGLSYTDTIPLLVAAIKEQQAMIEELKAKVAALEAK